MPRIARLVIPGCPHHVTQRGNQRQRVFFADSDRGLYFELLRRYFTRYRIAMAGYVLMSNHTHQVLIPALSDSLAKGVGRLHNDFARYQQIQLGLTDTSGKTDSFPPHWMKITSGRHCDMLN
jgi:putative transposase